MSVNHLLLLNRRRANLPGDLNDLLQAVARSTGVELFVVGVWDSDGINSLEFVYLTGYNGVY